MVGLAALLAAALWLSWQYVWRRLSDKIGDFCSYNLGLDDAGAAIAMSPIVVVLQRMQNLVQSGLIQYRDDISRWVL
jgi:hypothetical protein